VANLLYLGTVNPSNNLAYTAYHVNNGVQYIQANEGFYRTGHCWIRIKYKVLHSDTTFTYPCTQWRKYYPSTDLVIPSILYLPAPITEYRWEVTLLPDQPPVTWNVSFFEEVS
jgi:hypothetical protein